MESTSFLGMILYQLSRQTLSVPYFFYPASCNRIRDMKMGPGLYSDTGKTAKDLLNKDYHSDYKFTLTSVATSEVAITSTRTERGELLVADFSTKFVDKNITTDFNIDNNSTLLTRITVNDPNEGLKAIFSFKVPDKSSGKVELQYFHKNAGISTSIGLRTNPTVNFSGLFGNKIIALGTDLSFDTATWNFTKFNVGINYVNWDHTASLSVNDKGDTLNASLYLIINPRTHTAVGAELNRTISTKEKTLHIGVQHALDPLTLVKARVNNYGKVSALIQHEWRPKSLVTISGEVDNRAIEHKFGMALALEL